MGGYSIELFIDPELHKEFTCSVCLDVLKEPAMSLNCEHIYCTSCIENWAEAEPLPEDPPDDPNSSTPSCPIDRHPITGLRVPFRAFMNLYNDLKLKCVFHGCSTITTIGQIEAHMESCEFNPESIKPCVHGCGASNKYKDKSKHNCIKYLKRKIKAKDGFLAKYVKLGVEYRKEFNEYADLLREMGEKVRQAESDYLYLGLMETWYVKANREKERLQSTIKDKDEEIAKLQRMLLEKSRNNNTCEINNQEESDNNIFLPLFEPEFSEDDEADNDSEFDQPEPKRPRRTLVFPSKLKRQLRTSIRRQSSRS